MRRHDVVSGDGGGYTRPRRGVPDWFLDAKLGVFIHWGPYSVPAWAEPVGELGTIDGRYWFRHNPYAEWYANTIRFDDSPAREHHRAAYGDAPYDAFLDAWSVEEFEPETWMALFVACGAGYVVPTTKHHDGVALWDAPGSGTRNTVERGPRRDLVGAIERAARAAGLRFGVYYSGGLDWGISDLPPIDSMEAVRAVRPRDAAYAAYTYLQVEDLVDRFRPELLWNDIEWPDAGKHGRALGLYRLLDHFYATVPDGVINDRWGIEHWDFRTSEYQASLEHERAAAWQNCRGIGLSFGYNQVEEASHLIGGAALVRHFVDVVARGGTLLLNVGPTARGALPPGQRRVLEHLAGFMASAATVVNGSRPVAPAIAEPSETPWVRWLERHGRAWAVVEGAGRVELRGRAEALHLDGATTIDGVTVPAARSDLGVTVEVPPGPAPGPAVIGFPLR
jgi:alpha-L-fucosidase